MWFFFGLSVGQKDLPLVPVVGGSDVFTLYPDQLVIWFDRPLEITNNIKYILTVNGVMPLTVELLPHFENQLTLTMAKPFVGGDVLTWKYNNQHPTESIKDANGEEIAVREYPITNRLPILGSSTIDQTDITADTTLVTVDKGL